MRSLPVAAVTLVASLAVTAGCSGSAERGAHEKDDPQPGPSLAEETPSPSSESSAPPDDRAKKLLRRAIRNLRAANTGHITLSIPLTGDVNTVDQGDYQLRPLRADLTRTLSSEGSQMVFRYVTIGKDSWFRLEHVSTDESAEWACWVDVRDLNRLTGSERGTAAVPGQLPGALQVVSYGIGESFPDGATNEVEGTTDLYALMALIGGSELVTAGGLEPADTTTAPARFQLNGEMVTGFEVDLASIPREISESVAEHEYPWLSNLAESEGELIGYFAEIGQPIDIVAPGPGEIIEITDPSDFESEMRSCARGAEPT